jgi:hypothetical protein
MNDFNPQQFQQPNSQPVEQSSGGGSTKYIILAIILVLILCFVSIVCGLVGYYIYNNSNSSISRDNDRDETIVEEYDDEEDDIDEYEEEEEEEEDIVVSPTLAPIDRNTSGSSKYTSSKFGYSISTNPAWTINDTMPTDIKIETENGSVLNITTFVDPAYVVTVDINQSFCDTFTKSYKESTQNENHKKDSFYFLALKLNGNQGCQASGLTVDGYTQRFYVLFHKTKGEFYAVVYNLYDISDRAELDKAINSFTY